ncbi:MAG: sigma-70 family RNA polymerase sigma factor, partial [Actinomycetota bacterium]
RFDPDRGSALSWLMTIGHRKAVDRVRSAEAARRRDTAYEAQTQDAPFDQTVEQAHGNLEAQRVRRALDTLTEAQRGALELAYFGGYTHREVAVMLNLPLGTAKTRIRDGLIRLRDTLGLET